MNRKDRLIAATLLLTALYIWIRDLSWLSASADTLPVILALPAFIWLGAPWKFGNERFTLPSLGMAAAAAGFILGSITGWAALFALGWTTLLYSWLAARLEEEDNRRRMTMLLILPLMSFPWITLDGEALGWWFRLSGSWAAGALFSALGLNALQEGTRLLVNGVGVDVSAACSGLQTLQSMLIAGSALSYVMLGNHPLYWVNLPILLMVSWLANTLRIIAISAAALTLSPELAAGLFHEWGGWLVIFLMFALCGLLFSAERALLANQSQPPA